MYVNIRNACLHPNLWDLNLVNLLLPRAQTLRYSLNGHIVMPLSNMRQFTLV